MTTCQQQWDLGVVLVLHQMLRAADPLCGSWPDSIDHHAVVWTDWDSKSGVAATRVSSAHGIHNQRYRYFVITPSGKPISQFGPSTLPLPDDMAGALQWVGCDKLLWPRYGRPRQQSVLCSQRIRLEIGVDIARR
jgi:hypothetical protein